MHEQRARPPSRRLVRVVRLVTVRSDMQAGRARDELQTPVALAVEDPAGVAPLHQLRP